MDFLHRWLLSTGGETSKYSTSERYPIYTPVDAILEPAPSVPLSAELRVMIISYDYGIEEEAIVAAPVQPVSASLINQVIRKTFNEDEVIAAAPHEPISGVIRVEVLRKTYTEDDALEASPPVPIGAWIRNEVRRTEQSEEEHLVASPVIPLSATLVS